MCSAAKERKKTEDDPMVETERKTNVYTYVFQITNNPAPTMNALNLWQQQWSK